jgi:predicted metal-dependent phosphotriesterase family hydrolase
MNSTRRHFIRSSLFAVAGCMAPPQKGKVITVNGPISPEQMGLTLAHEHVLVDFIGANKISSDRYNRQKVYDTILPYLRSLRSKGCKTLVECTPAYLGRDVRLLQQLSKGSDLHIITNTGWYGASKEKFLPAKVKELSSQQIADEWIVESRKGIDSTGIKPGFMKIAVDDVPFSDNISRILEAAAFTYKATGLPIGIHTSNGGAPAKQQMKIFETNHVPLSSWIWIHAQNEKDISIHIEAAKKGAWISFDNVSGDNMDDYLERLKQMKTEGLLGQVLISHDAGWYDVVDPTKKIRGYSDIFDLFIPYLKKNNFSTGDIEQLLVQNPARAFTVRS